MIVYRGFGSIIIEIKLIKPQGDTPYNGLYGEAPPERGIFSGFRYMKG